MRITKSSITLSSIELQLQKKLTHKAKKLKKYWKIGKFST